ncbi:MAG: ASCH domain-containing protein [Microthrixaceae bacterium]
MPDLPASVSGPSHERVMLLSIHPAWVGRIINGSKTVELRKTRPLVSQGQLVLIYSTKPTAAIVATCRISRVEVVETARAWTSFGPKAAISEAELDQYLLGAKEAVGIHVDSARELASPIDLDFLRERDHFHPPQTWHYLDLRDLKNLIADHDAWAEIESEIGATSLRPDRQTVAKI